MKLSLPWNPDSFVKRVPQCDEAMTTPTAFGTSPKSEIKIFDNNEISNIRIWGRLIENYLTIVGGNLEMIWETSFNRAEFHQ